MRRQDQSHGVGEGVIFRATYFFEKGECKELIWNGQGYNIVSLTVEHGLKSTFISDYWEEYQTHGMGD